MVDCRALGCLNGEATLVDRFSNGLITTTERRLFYVCSNPSKTTLPVIAMNGNLPSSLILEAARRPMVIYENQEDD